MKKNIICLLAAIYSITALCEDKNTKFPNVGFLAEFPKDTHSEKTKADIKFGVIETTTYSFEGEDYLVLLSENTYAVDLFTKLKAKGTERMLDGYRNGAVKNLEAQSGETFEFITNEKFSYNNKFPAIKFSGSAGDSVLESLCILKDNDYFILMLMGNSKSDEVQKFLKSYKIQ